MSSPIYRDPIYDGASDPVVVRRPDEAGSADEWWMFYTQRRATVPGPGVAWVHGSRIGRAVSTDGGASWQYRGTIEGLDEGGNTHWAPEVVADGDGYRMYLTMIEGIPDHWENIERVIREYTSPDLENWSLERTLDLSSRLVIDAAVARCADGLFRLWYKDEGHESTTWAASSPGLDGEWTVEGKVIGLPAHEGPNVFQLGGWYWMITDEWRGQAVHRSTDGVRWERQAADDGLILHEPGEHPEDREWGRHADVVVQPATSDGPEHAIVFYFTHPYWGGVDEADPDVDNARRTVIHVARLEVVDGVLTCDRNIPGELTLRAPTDS